MTILIAPTEPRAIKEHLRATTSSAPELYGVDYMWGCDGGFGGAQRKEVADLVASMNDGRLVKEVGQMQDCLLQARYLIVEGKLRWSTDGELMHNHVKIGRNRFEGMMLGVQARGIGVVYTTDHFDTGEMILFLRKRKGGEGGSSMSRPGPNTPWGKAGNHEFAVHVLTSFPGIGRGTAEKIIEKFGRVPLRWDATREELMEVEGVGKVRADRLLAALEASGVSGSSGKVA